MFSEATLNFPSQFAIVADLMQHPLTKDLYLNDKKIIEAVARFFADEREVHKDEVYMGVMLAMRVRLLEPIDGITSKLTKALKDCAHISRAFYLNTPPK